jgi:hypothetical protein
MDEAWDRLTHVERVEWTLGELLVLLHDGRFHIWIQSCADPERSAGDWPGRLHTLASAGSAASPEHAALLHWTAERAAAVRRGVRGEALFSVVDAVWRASWPGVVDWWHGIVERWPVDRPLVASKGPPRATKDPGRPVLAALPTRGELIDGLMLELWRAGASDDLLDEAYVSVGGASHTAREVARWAELTADLDALERSFDPVAERLGFGTGPLQWVVVDEDLADLADALPGSCLVRRGERPVRDQLWVALRLDPSVVLVEGAALDEESAEIVFRAVLSGFRVGVGRPLSSAGEALLRRLEEPIG